jgi:hypothetical protein
MGSPHDTKDVRIDLGGGIVARFAGNSGQFKLMKVEFGDEWQDEDIGDWMADRDLRLYEIKGNENRKVPDVDFFVEDGELVCLVCWAGPNSVTVGEVMAEAIPWQEEQEFPMDNVGVVRWLNTLGRVAEKDTVTGKEAQAIWDGLSRPRVTDEDESVTQLDKGCQVVSTGDV